MGDKSKIEWTDASWSPIRARNKATGKVGWHCEHATPGCEFCYAEGLNKRLGTGLPFKPGHRKDIEIFLDEKMLLQPLRWKQPRMIFVCSMTDLFADFVSDEWIADIFGVMAVAGAAGPFHREADGCREAGSWTASNGEQIPLKWPNLSSGPHVFQVLTKRAARMRELLSNGRFITQVAQRAYRHAHDRIDAGAIHDAIKGGLLWPLPNVWLGVSCEDQKRAEERIPHLLHTPAAVRFISAEPLLGPIDFTSIEIPRRWGTALLNTLTCEVRDHHNRAMGEGPPSERMPLSWVISGGESGLNARPAHPQWFRDIRDQCGAAGVAYFHKQNGEFASVSEVEGAGAHHEFPDGSRVRRVGKTKAGRLLDGREHNDMPGSI